MTGSIYSWSTTAASNANSDGDINFAEGQPPSTLNNSNRQGMGRVAEYIADQGGALTAGGTANALTVTANSAFTAFQNGLTLALRIATDNTTAATLNVNGLGAKSIRKMVAAGESALAGGELQQDGIYLFLYSTALNAAAGGWLLLNPTIDLSSFATIAAVDVSVPVGMVVDYAGATAPTNWLFLYGQAVSRTTYAALFAILGTTYGAGDGSTTFNLPDARGRVIAGKDNMGGSAASRLTGQSGGVTGTTLGGSGGVETHTLTTAQLAAHTHTGTTSASGTHTHDISYANVQNGTGGFGTPNFSSTGSTKTTTAGGDHTHTFTSDSNGSGSAHNNVQPTLILNKIIKALAT